MLLIEWGNEIIEKIERNTLILGDCIDVFESNCIEDGSVDAIIVDLPYARTQNKWDELIPLTDYVVDGKKILYKDEYLLKKYKEGVSYKEGLKTWNREHKKGLWYYYNRLIKDNGVIILFCDGMFMADVMRSNAKQWRYNIVWNKILTSGFLNANRQPLRQHEEIVVFYKKSPSYNPQKKKGKPNHSKGSSKKNTNNNYGKFEIVDNRDKLGDMKHPTSIWTFQKPHPSTMVHPTEKPVDLLKELVLTYTNEGELVLDNCMGSGTTGVACKELGRDFIGIEKNSIYFETAKSRILV